MFERAGSWAAGAAVLLGAWALPGCGGDGSSAGPLVLPAPTAVVSTAPTRMAGATVVLDGGDSRSVLARPLSYRWVLESRPAGSAALLAGAETRWARFDADRPGDYIVVLQVHDGVQASPPARATVSVLPTDTLRIFAINEGGDPLAGSIRFSLTGPVVGAPVHWLLCGVWKGSGTTLALPAQPPCLSPWLEVTAQIEVAPGRAPVEVKRLLLPDDALPFRMAARLASATAPFVFDVHLGSPYGVEAGGLSASLDGQPAMPFNQPYPCTGFASPFYCPFYAQLMPCDAFHPFFCSSFSNTHRFTLDSRGLPPGLHQVRFRAIDLAGDTREVTVEFTVPPAVPGPA